MGKEAKEVFQEKSVGTNFKPQDNSWVIMESCDYHEDVTSDLSTRSVEENSINSVASSSSSDLVEDANSSSSSFKSLSSSTISSSSSTISFSPPNNNGPLYELSELMVHLPLRRGLSKFYQGKSQSFTSLASVKSSEDLPKKVAPFRKKIMKPCKSYGGDLDVHKLHSPKAIIAKKSPRASSFLASHLGSFRPSVPMQKNY